MRATEQRHVRNDVAHGGTDDERAHGGAHGGSDDEREFTSSHGFYGAHHHGGTDGGSHGSAHGECADDECAHDE